MVKDFEKGELIELSNWGGMYVRFNNWVRIMANEQGHGDWFIDSCGRKWHVAEIKKEEQDGN